MKTEAKWVVKFMRIWWLRCEFETEGGMLLGLFRPPGPGGRSSDPEFVILNSFVASTLVIFRGLL
jgi:hypothetical protein